MSKAASGLFSGTKGSVASLDGKSAKSNNTKSFQGGRTREEYSNLARDPARGTKVDNKGKKERSIILDLERQGKIGRVIRDPQKDKGADFIDTTNNQKWDIKSPISHPKGHTSARKGAFNVDRMLSNVKKEIARRHKVVLDTRRLNKTDRQKFKDAIKAEGLNEHVIWYDKKGIR